MKTAMKRVNTEISKKGLQNARNQTSKKRVSCSSLFNSAEILCFPRVSAATDLICSDLSVCISLLLHKHNQSPINTKSKTLKNHKWVKLRTHDSTINSLDNFMSSQLQKNREKGHLYVGFGF